MMIGFYAPELEDHLAVLMQYRERFGEVMVRRIKLGTQRNKSEVIEIRGDLIAQTKGITDACEVMQKQVVALSKRYM